jgi:hypothetical protein
VLDTILIIFWYGEAVTSGPRRLTETSVPQHHGRSLLLYLLSDGTISYFLPHETIVGDGKPVFAVRTVEEAEYLLVSVGRVQWRRHPLMRDRP